MKRPANFLYFLAAVAFVLIAVMFSRLESNTMPPDAVFSSAPAKKPTITKVSNRITLAAADYDPTCDGSDGGMADDTGLKVWCWDDIELPDYSGKKGAIFSNGQLHIDSECYEKQITQAGNRLSFKLDPMHPTAADWCSNDFNMRAEIRTAPWNVRHETGTEEWFGWSYTLGDDYIIDQNNEWMMFQVYPGPAGLNPQISLQVLSRHQIPGVPAGTLYVANSCYPQQGSASDYQSTGIVPVAGQQLNIVVHVIWGEASEGLLQVWIDGETVYDKQVPTVYASHPWGGNAKWGIYKFPWRAEKRVRQSVEQGITGMQAFMGPLRMITRAPNDEAYGENSYSVVAPK